MNTTTALCSYKYFNLCNVSNMNDFYFFNINYYSVYTKCNVSLLRILNQPQINFKS